MPEKVETNLGLSYGWDEGEDGWSAGMDKNLTRLGAFVALEVISADIADPPGSPSEGDRYIVASPATGAWTGQENAVAVYLEGTWTFHGPYEGLRAYIGPDAVMARYDEATTQWLRGEQRVRVVSLPSGELEGELAALAAGNGIYLARLQPDGTYDQNAGAIELSDGRVAVFGAQLVIPGFTHSNPEGRYLVASETGEVYLGDPVANLWTQNSVDASNYTTLGSGTGAGPWVEMTGIDITLGQTVEIGEVLSVSLTLQITEQGGRGGDVEAIFALDGATPGGGDTPDFVFPVAANQDGLSSRNFSRVQQTQLLAGTVLTIFARRNNGEQNAYNPELLGTTDPHQLVISRIA